MIDKTDPTGKGPHRPGEAPRRPFATIDLQATEIGRSRDQAAPGREKPEPRLALPLPGRDSWGRVWAALTGPLAAAWTWAATRLAGIVRGSAASSHTLAGVAGAALTLVAASLLGLLATSQGDGGRLSADVAQRLAAVEKAVSQRSALSEDATVKVADATARLAKLEERLQAVHGKLVADAKALEARIPSADIAERTAKLETALAALAAADKAGGGDAGEAKAANARVERDLVALKGEAAGLRRSLETLQGSTEERLKGAAKAADLASVLGKLAAFEQGLQGVLKTEGERVAGTQQVLLTLELANLKRALDRGDGYARELEAVRKVGAGGVDLAALDRHSHTGLPTLGVLADEFKGVAHKAADAESERADASVLDRLVAGARSVVRLRKARYDADDTSVEAVLARMETALRDGHIGEVLAEGRRLPPKAALAAEDWLRKLEARHAADRAVADIEAALKAALARPEIKPETKPEPKR